MRSGIFLASLSLISLAVAVPASDQPSKSQADDFALVGYAKSNSIGETTGGAGGTTTTVTSPTALKTAVAGTKAAVVYLSGSFKLPSRLSVGSNKSLIGTGSGANITSAGINIEDGTNVIIRNLQIAKIKGNDGITIQNSTRVWIDHNELYSEFSEAIGPDTYDGQIDIVHASDWITVSYNYLHDHWKSSLVGNSDANRAEDFGHLHVTYHHNYWKNEGTRGPAGRFGHQHVYNNLYEDYHYQAIHSRSDNQVLVEGNVFRGNTTEALSTYGLVIPKDSPNTSPNGDPELDGYANLGATNDWGPATINITQTGDFTKAPYTYTLTPLASVESVVKAGAGIGKI